ncbi:MAG: glycosyltransferase, partial [Ardenticatenales bacterium]|nr:glycosyltransferase [Ardenticatenales bacterium]
MANFILMSHSTGGDVYPYIKIGQSLRERGHTVTLLSHIHYETVARRANLNFAAVDTPADWQEYLEDNPFNHINPTSNLDSVLAFQRKFDHAEKILAEYHLIQEYCTADTVLISRDRSLSSMLLVAEKRQIPIIAGVVSPYFLRLCF